MNENHGIFITELHKDDVQLLEMKAKIQSLREMLKIATIALAEYADFMNRTDIAITALDRIKKLKEGK